MFAHSELTERGRHMYKILASMAATFLLSLALTPLIRGLALKIGAVDNPNARRVNKVPMPTMGGLAILSHLISQTSHCSEINIQAIRFGHCLLQKF